MATDFPAALDALANPAAGDTQAGVPHAAQHANANDAVEALQAKVGVDDSAVATSLDYLVKKGVAIVAAAAPTAPVVNQLWYDTTAELLKRWDGDSWEAHDHDAAYQPVMAVESATQNTSGSTTSLAYTDLSTAGPAVTVDVPASGKVMVLLTTYMENNTAGADSRMSVALSGANTQAASDDNYLMYESSNANDRTRHSVAVPFTGLAAGSTTFTAKYMASAGTATFLRRQITVITYP